MIISMTYQFPVESMSPSTSEFLFKSFWLRLIVDSFHYWFLSTWSICTIFWLNSEYLICANHHLFTLMTVNHRLPICIFQQFNISGFLESACIYNKFIFIHHSLFLFLMLVAWDPYFYENVIQAAHIKICH